MLHGEMRKVHGLKPTIKSYRHAFRACELLGDVTRALRTYEETKTRGIRLDNKSLLCLVRLLEGSGQLELDQDIRRERSEI